MSKEVFQMVEELKKRYACYMEEKGAFPHEIGLLLGYPVEEIGRASCRGRV